VSNKAVYTMWMQEANGQTVQADSKGHRQTQAMVWRTRNQEIVSSWRNTGMEAMGS